MNPYSEQFSVEMQSVEKVVSRIFSREPLRIESAMGGISTSVYRIFYPNETFYLRLLPNTHDSFASEVAVHTQLHQKQVNAPAVVHFEHFNEILQRSIMATTAIKGSPVMHSPSLNENERHTIMVDAGRDLARINTIAVDGYGWLRGRIETTVLSAPYSSHKDFVLADWENSILFLASTILSSSEVSMLEQIIPRFDDWLDSEQGRLAHGDFSTRHVFQEDGHYTGIIDFGDSQGTDGWYDMGYFHMRDGGPLLPQRLESALLAGYGEIIPLPPDYEQRIRFSSILITVKALAYMLQRQSPDLFTQHQLHTLQYDLKELL